MAGMRVFTLGNLPEYDWQGPLQEPITSIEVTAPYFDWMPWILFLGISVFVILKPTQKR